MNSNQLCRNRDQFYKTWTSERFTADRNNPQTIPSNVAVTPPGELVIFESVGPSLDNISYSGGVFTFKREGLYTVEALIVWTADATGARCANFRVNGDTVIRFRDCKNALSSGSANNNINMTWHFAVGDTLEVFLIQTTINPLDILGKLANPTNYTTMEINLLQNTA